MKKINLAITGCMGRMGQQLIKSSKNNKNFKLVALTESRLINKKFNGIKPDVNSDKTFKKTDVIIDFTVPECTLEILKIASKQKKKVVIGTTGFNRNQESQIKKVFKKDTYFKSW
jgi:4-hydroxy-tetrahydrodipicolinate reductase